MDGSEHDVGGVILGIVGRADLRPVEEAGLAAAGHAFERGNENDVPFQTLGVVDGEEFDAGGAEGDGVGFGVESLQSLVEQGRIDAGTVRFQRVEQLEEAAGVSELGSS